MVTQILIGQDVKQRGKVFRRHTHDWVASIRTWSKTQATIALSSTEAELFGEVKTACETLGVASLLKDLGQDVKLRMHTDASVALGTAQRRGVGKVRHMRAGTLWLQEKQSKKI